MELRLDDQRVFVADQGKGLAADRRTLLFVHGAGMDHSVWPLQARHFAYRGWNALAVDLPGHGRTSGAPLASIEAMADWLGRLIAALGVGQTSLVGHSMGALAALACAARQRPRIERVALLGAALAMPVHPALLEAAARPEALAPELICDWGFGPAGHFGGHRSPGSWMLGHAQALLRRSAGPLLATDLAACNVFRGGSAAAAGVRCPSLVLAGAADRMTPQRQAERLARALEGARLVTLEGCGHMMMVERPDATLDALLGFFAGLPDPIGKI